MSSLPKLEQRVRQLYEAKDPERSANWADWLYEHHVFVVADFAGQLAKRFGANEELARAAGMLHDIADISMKRANPHHEQESLRIARGLLSECGYSAKDIALVVDDAIAKHSCHDDVRPESLEGKVLATADSLAHLKTDFYLQAIWLLASEKTMPEIKKWTLAKIERDLNNKILFDEVKTEVRPDYELIKGLFSR